METGEVTKQARSHATDESSGTSRHADAHRRHFRYWSPLLAAPVAAWAVALGALAPDPLALVARNWVFVPIGVAGALLGNISAIGGGLVFIPCVIFVFHLPPVTALKIALATQSVGMTSGAVGWLQKRAVPLRALRFAVPGLLIGSCVSSFAVRPSAAIVKGVFGPVSIALGILTLALTARSPGRGRTDIPDRARLPLFLCAVAGGMVTGWVAIGEGELVAAMLMLGYGVDVTAAVGLGVVLLAVNSIFLTLIHALALGGVPWSYVAFTALGALFGARLAPWVSRHFSPRALRTTFAAIAIGDGMVFVYQYLRSLPG